MKKKIGIITLGCKVNQYESEAFAEALTDLGYEICEATEPCDAYIVNSCTVTAEADRKSKQMIRRAARANKNAVVVVTGCTAEYSSKHPYGYSFRCRTLLRRISLRDNRARRNRYRP